MTERITAEDCRLAAQSSRWADMAVPALLRAADTIAQLEAERDTLKAEKAEADRRVMEQHQQWREQLAQNTSLTARVQQAEQAAEIRPLTQCDVEVVDGGIMLTLSYLTGPASSGSIVRIIPIPTDQFTQDARAELLAQVRQVWDTWRAALPFGSFTHADGVQFVQALDALTAPQPETQT